MARIRTIKPSFFSHYDLYQAEKETGLPLRVAYAGLWTQADREGRFKWCSPELKLGCLPYDDLDFSRVLDALAKYDFIRLYEVDGKEYGYVPSWHSHQSINQREAQSVIPAPTDNAHMHAHARIDGDGHLPNGVNVPHQLRETVLARDGHKCVRCGRADDLTIDHIFPRSIGGTHAIGNLRSLCRSCNSARPVCGDGLIEDLQKDNLTLDDIGRICKHVQAHGEGKGKEGKGKEGADPRKRGSRLQTDWTLPEDWKAWALKEQPSWTQAHVEKVATGFRNYWIAKSGKDAAKLDWYATWQNWVMREPALSAGGKAANWWDDDQATLAKGREYGLEPRSGEDWRAFKARINERLRVAA